MIKGGETAIMDIVLVRALLRLHSQRLPRSRLVGVPEVFWHTFRRDIALLGVETALGTRAATHGSLRR